MRHCNAPMNGTPPLIHTPYPAPRRAGWVVYSVIVSILLFISVFANFIMFAVVVGPGGGETFHRNLRYQEVFVDGDERARDKIAVIDLVGVIMSEGDGRSGDGIAADIEDQLRQAVDDKHVKAIVLRINSPGGEVVASDNICEAVAGAREEKPVVANIDSVGASGAYYAAVGANHIIAHELAITGSIGVILQSYTFGDLMGKIGVHSYTFKSGKYKDVLNPTREPTEDEKALVQSLVLEVYEKFVGVVANERHMNVEELKAGLADGRIMSGRQAVESGFVDEVGYFGDAVAKAEELGKIKEHKVKVIRYVAPFSLRNVFQLFGKSEAPKIQVELGSSQFKLQSGKLYYLPAYLFQ